MSILGVAATCWGVLVVGVFWASTVRASTVAGRDAEFGVDGVEEGLGIEILGLGRSWTEGLGVAEETYLSALDFRGSGLESGAGLDRDFGSFFCVVSLLVAAITCFVVVF